MAQYTWSANERVDPVAKYKFWIEVKDVVAAWFTECSGLSVEREAIPQKEGGVNDYVHQLPGRISYSRITLITQTEPRPSAGTWPTPTQSSGQGRIFKAIATR
jgi:hypothetical protein